MLAPLAVAAVATAKPPDLPINPNDTIPILPMPPFDSMPPGVETQTPMPEPLPGWPTITIEPVPQCGSGPCLPQGQNGPTTLTVYPSPNGTVVSIDPSPMPAPPMMTIYHPVRPAMPLSVRRTFDKCLLFGANPVLSLVPLPESLREEQHTAEEVPVPRCRPCN